MYSDDQSIKAFERIHARDLLAEQARHIEDEDARELDGHLAGEREAQRLMVIVGFAVVATLLGVLMIAL